MIGWRARRSMWPLAVIATLGSALSLQACSGKVERPADCGSSSSCGGMGGSSGDKGQGGSAAIAGEAGTAAAPGTCMNSQKDPDESDVDCGGPGKCARCSLNARCSTNSDCETDLCSNKRCAEPRCDDGIRNQDETDVDCGGSCLPCNTGLLCASDADCEGQYCTPKTLCGDHCTSGKREADETDTDCGGATCEPCTENQRCRDASDCTSSVCSKGRCAAATCHDKIQNQDESDIDCGGVCSDAQGCPVGARCNSAADCDSYICSATTAKCLADIVVPAAGDVIDDFEDGDSLLPKPARGGRVGNWYTYGDGTGIVSMAVVAIERGASSVKGLRTTGKDFNNWGSGVGVDLNNTGSKAAYDASAFSGITFWARAASSTAFTVAFPDTDTDAAGGICTICAHDYYKTFTASTEWQRFTVKFSDLSLEPGGAPAPVPAFKPSGLMSVLFRLSAGVTYEMEIDDIALIKG
ncbi:MAG TPA: carbohydrate binding domain-containing protein [Polyangiaceae bacterium]|nr:carbohydrate binding domain-containing protein [Polyangiaceae bacterium]